MWKNTSKEFQLLIELIKADAESIDLTGPFIDIQWEEFYRLVSYHQLRHMLFAQQILVSQMPMGLQTRLRNFNLNRAKNRIQNQQEILALITLFEESQLNPLLIKGELFSYYTQTNKQIRESTDIDLLFPADEVPKAAQLLLQRAYTMRDKLDERGVDQLAIILKERSKHSFFTELHFDKKPFNIDLHWNLNNAFLPYAFPIEKLFLEKEKIVFLGKEINSINVEGFFWSILVHHGGKEYWLRLKVIVDFSRFLRVHQTVLPWKKLEEEAKTYGLFTLLLNGLWYSREIGGLIPCAEIEELIENYTPKVYKNTLKFWQRAKFWNQPLARFHYEWILVRSQDKDFSFLKYLHKFYLAYIESHPLQEKAFFRSFPPFQFLAKIWEWFFRKRKIA